MSELIFEWWWWWRNKITTSIPDGTISDRGGFSRGFSSGFNR